VEGILTKKPLHIEQKAGYSLNNYQKIMKAVHKTPNMEKSKNFILRTGGSVGGSLKLLLPRDYWGRSLRPMKTGFRRKR
jgi:hypothetical protein